MPFMTFVSVSTASPPTGVTAVGGNGSISLNWTAPSGYSGNYDAQRAPHGGSYSSLFTNTAGTTYLDSSCGTGATGFTGYWDYQVARTGQTNWSAAATASPYSLCDIWSGAANTAISGRTPNVSAGGPSSGDTWHQENGSFILDGSGNVKNNATTESICVADATISDGTIQAPIKYTAAPGGFGIYLRGRDTDVNNGWIAGLESAGTLLNLYKEQTGSYTSVEQVGVSLANNTFATLLMNLNGNTAYAQLGSTSTATYLSASFNNNATRWGIQSEMSQAGSAWWGNTTVVSS